MSPGDRASGPRGRLAAPPQARVRHSPWYAVPMRVRIALGAAVVGVLAVGACTGDDPVLPGIANDGDGGGDAPLTPDVGSPDATADVTTDSTAGGCRADAELGAPEPLPDINATGGKQFHVVGARPIPTGILFASEAAAAGANVEDFSGLDLYFALATQTGYAPPKKLGASATAVEDWAPTLTAGGTLLFGSLDGTRRAFYRSTYTGGAADERELVTFGNSINEYFTPYAAGSRLYFAMVDNSGLQPVQVLASAAIAAGGVLDTPERVTGIDVPDELSAPVVTIDEKTLYFAATKAGTTTIYRATRPQPSGPFSKATALPAPMNALTQQFPSAVSADGCDLYLHARVSGGRYAVYRARKPRSLDAP